MAPYRCHTGLPCCCCPALCLLLAVPVPCFPAATSGTLSAVVLMTSASVLVDTVIQSHLGAFRYFCTLCYRCSLGYQILSVALCSAAAKPHRAVTLDVIRSWAISLLLGLLEGVFCCSTPGLWACPLLFCCPRFSAVLNNTPPLSYVTSFSTSVFCFLLKNICTTL